MLLPPAWRAGQLLLALRIAAGTAGTAPPAVTSCLGEYELCAAAGGGGCALDASLCGRCAGAYLCPDGATCAASAEAVLATCPLVPPLYDWRQPLAARVAATLPLLTAAEKASLVVMVSPGVPRLSIPAYNFWVEAQHGAGVGDVAPASSGPQTASLASAFSPDLMRRMAQMSATEARARHNEAVHAGVRLANQYSLTAFSPEMNLVRWPLWGRVQEGMGEDPLLTARLAGGFVAGLQEGIDDELLFVSATCKDFPIYDVELAREDSNKTLTARDLAETYLPPFIGCASSAGAAAVMLAYAGVQLLPGQAAATSAVANGAVMGLLRDAPESGGMGWQGLIMSDCDAVWDLLTTRRSEPDAAHAAAAALTAGTDLELNILPVGCGGNEGFAYSAAPEAIAEGLMDEAALDASVTRILTIRGRLGMFEPPTAVPFNTLGNESILSPEHVALTRSLASAAVVLLTNRGGVLPLAPAALRRLALVGPAIDDGAVMLGDYADMHAPAVSLAAAAALALPEAALAVARGCADTACNDTAGFAAAAAACAGADAVILQLGLCSDACDGSPGRGPSQEHEGGDRTALGLPGEQAGLAAAVRAAAPASAPLVCVLFHGGVLDLAPVLDVCDAIVSAGYPGMQGGPGVFDVLLGVVPAAGKSTLTWYSAAALAALAPPADNDMYSSAGAGRTYRFYNASSAPPVLFPFGHGLGYSSFTYSDLRVQPASSPAAPADPCAQLTLTATLCNVGGVDTDEVAQVYLATPDGPLPAPLQRLVGFRRVHMQAGGCAPLSFSLPPPAWVASAAGSGSLATQAGRIVLSVGGGQPGYDPGVARANAFLAAPRALAECAPGGGPGGAFQLQRDFYASGVGRAAAAVAAATAVGK